MSCCRRRSGMSPKIKSMLMEKLRRLRSLRPAITFSAIVGPLGEVLVYESFHENQVPEEILPIVNSMKIAAKQYGGSLDQTSDKIIRIAGESNVFSCFEIDDHLLVYYYRRSGDSGSVFSVEYVEAEEPVVDIAEDLRHLLRNLA